MSQSENTYMDVQLGVVSGEEQRKSAVSVCLLNGDREKKNKGHNSIFVSPWWVIISGKKDIGSGIGKLRVNNKMFHVPFTRFLVKGFSGHPRPLP